MLAAVTCFFNPCGWANRIANLQRFRESFSGCPLIIIEASFTGCWVYQDSIHIDATDQNKWLWQKERLLNLAVESLPANVDKVAWIDADLLFFNPDWAHEAEQLLDDHAVCQLFDTVHYLDPDGRRLQSHNSIASPRRDCRGYAHVGFAWAARREVFPLYDYSICGAGDAVMAAWWMLDSRNHRSLQMSLRQWDASQDYRERAGNLTSGRIGCVPGDIEHLWHGSIADRRYPNRSDRFRALDFDPRRDIQIDTNGLWKWTGENKHAETFLREYMLSRNEDSSLIRPRIRSPRIRQIRS